MNNWTKASLIALRIVVGWHFLYEGLWKIDSDNGSTSYTTSRYTLQATTARMRDYFERTPPGELKLEPALARVDDWHDSIVKAFAAQKQLDEPQKARLGMLRDTVKLAAVSAVRGEADGEDVVGFDWPYVHEEVLKMAPLPEGEGFSSLGYLQGSTGPFRPLFRGLITDIGGAERLTVASAHARIDERYGEILRHFESAKRPFSAEQRNKLGAGRDAIKASVAAMLSDEAFQVRLADYRAVSARVQSDEARLSAPFSRERIDADGKKLDVIAGELLALVNEPLAELAVRTQAIATVEQLGAGPIPKPDEPAAWVDRGIKIALTAIGACLLLGVFTPLAALAAAAQLAMFYLASPPWPGLPAATLGGHFLYVDRNLIELVAALVIAATATGLKGASDDSQ
jgi:uncharacterized membrane protein YphA (DoxX/SURF4 family)